MGKKVVLDTNVLISALGWGGNPKMIFIKCIDGHLSLVTSKEQLDELQRVLEYPKFGFTETQILVNHIEYRDRCKYIWKDSRS